MKQYVENIRKLRESKKLSQEYIAELLGTTQQVYSRYENANNELPVRHLVTLCKFYKVSADDVLGLKG